MAASKRLFATLIVGLTLLLGVFGLAQSAQAAPYSGGASVSSSTSNPSEGGTFTVSGSGFGANDKVTITLDNGDVLGTATTNGVGAFSASVTLPNGVTCQHTISFTDAATGQTATESITIGSCGSGSGGSSSGSGSGGSLASTGVAVASIGGAGVLLFAGGLTLLFLGRRRRVTA